MKMPVILTISILCFSQLLFGQKTSTDYIDWAWEGEFRPFIEGSFGISQQKQKDFQGTFANDGLVELKLGYSEVRKFKNYVWSLDDRYIFGSYFSTDLYPFDEDTTGTVTTELPRFGFSQRDGYGYNVGPFQLVGFNTFSFAWTELKSQRPASLSGEDVSILDRYEGTFRFGQVYEGGLRFQLFKSLAVNGSFEGAVVYPRLIFWEWLGSFLIQYSAISALTVWSEDIVGRTQLLGPVLYLALKSALYYGLYNAMTYNMNWPFTSEKPMTIETFKVGISITF
jgi:hypothetical protein